MGQGGRPLGTWLVTVIVPAWSIVPSTRVSAGLFELPAPANTPTKWNPAVAVSRRRAASIFQFR
jgi:hypothetical protein